MVLLFLSIVYINKIYQSLIKIVEPLDLNYLEDVITYSAIRGDDREIICPSIIEYINEDTFLKEGNLCLLNIVRIFYLEHARIPTLSEIKLYIKGDEDMKKFIDFVKMCKVFDKKLDMDKMLLIRSIEEFLKQRIMLGVLKEAHIKEVAGNPLDHEEIYTKLDGAMGIYLMDDIGLNLFTDHEEYIEKLVSTDTRISTGFKWLDEQIGGGLLASGSVLYNFCAASNVGKSNFIKSMAGNISKGGKNVLVVSLEMPRFIYANRFVSELSDIPISNLKDNIDGVTGFLSSAKDEGYGDIIIKDFATGSITPQALLAYIKRVQKTLDIKFDVIFVDYPELLKPSRTFSGRHDLTVAQQYVETRAISFALETPIVAVAQLNRSAYKSDTPSMENIGNGIGIMQCSDLGAFLYSTDELKQLNMMGMIIGKSRFGPVNRTMKYIVDPDTLKIRESTQEYLETPKDIKTKDDYLENIEDENDNVLNDLFSDD